MSPPGFALRLAASLLLAAGCGGDDPPAADRSAEPPAPVDEGPFVEAAAASGLDFVHFNGMSGELTYSEMMGAGAAVFDYDNDGDLDVYLVQGNLLDPEGDLAGATFPPPPEMLPLRDRLYRNDLAGGRLSFTDVTAESGLDAIGYGMGVAAADYDNDGWTDFYLTQAGGRGDGTFGNEAMLSGTAFNREGQPEAGMGVAAGDYDNDGDPDLWLTHIALETHTLYRNDGGGAFEDVTRASGLGTASWQSTGFGTAWADVDNDGWLDLLAVNGGVILIPEQVAAGDPIPSPCRTSSS